MATAVSVRGQSGRARYAAGAMLLLSGGCGSPAPAQDARSLSRASVASAKAPSVISPARIFALPDSPAVTRIADPDGSRRLIAHGMRLVEHVDRSLERSDELLPPGRLTTTLDLPARLGGGHLFYSQVSGSGPSSVQVWRSKSWTGKLEPFANVEAHSVQIVAGFDRLYLVERQSGEVRVALKADTGEPTDLGALPPSPAYGSMVFADAWLGAIDVPLRGVLATFDAGASFRPLGSWALAVRSEADEIVVTTTEGQFALGSDGRLRQRALGAGSDSLFEGAGRTAPAPAWRAGQDQPEAPAPLPPGPLGRRPLHTAALHGWPDSPASAVVAAGGALARVQLSDGKLLDVAEHAMPDGGSCHAVALGESFGFVCGEERARTVVYAFVPPLGVRQVMSFDQPRYVASSGNGALVIRGGCAAASSAYDTYCIRAPGGAVREIRVRGDLGVERVVALRDGRAAVIVPPRLRAPGRLTIVDAAGRSRSVELALPAREPPVLALLKQGLWLNGFSEPAPGVLAGWVVGAGPFLGVKVDLDGEVDAGKIENDIHRAVLSGQLGMVLGGRSGVAFESVDGGFRWREVELPTDLEIQARSSTTVGERAEQGCSPVGCAFSTWMRIGWSGKADRSRLAVAEIPRVTRRPPPGGGRWLVECSATGEASAPSLSATDPKPRVARFSFGRLSPATEEGISEWRAFLEYSPPARRGGEAGFDTGTEADPIQLRAYAWGAKGAGWDRAGRFQVRVADRFTLARGIWSTEVTKSPWADQVTAAQAFGADVTSPTATSWRAVLEASGRAAALLVTARGTRELYLLEEDRPVVAVRDAAQQGLGEPLSIVKLGSAWYLGHVQGQTFRLLSVEGDRMRVLQEYPLRMAGARAMLVRSLRGDALAVWVRGAGGNAYLFPIDRDSGQVSDPFEVSARMLADLPRACTSDDDGFLVVDKPSPEPRVEFDGFDSLRVKEVEARLLVGPLGICTETLAAQRDPVMPNAMKRTAGSGPRAGRAIPFVLTDRGIKGRRWGFRCSR